MQLPELITTYLDQLNDVEHERLLTTTLVPNTTSTILPSGDRAGCLVGVARGAAEMAGVAQRGWWSLLQYDSDWTWGGFSPHLGLAPQFNKLAQADQPGTQQAIRDYILALRAQRAEFGERSEAE